MSQPAAAATQEMPGDLVHQFSDTFAFYRKLVQAPAACMASRDQSENLLPPSSRRR